MNFRGREKSLRNTSREEEKEGEYEKLEKELKRVNKVLSQYQTKREGRDKKHKGKKANGTSKEAMD